ncbi:hypothetical protein JNB11_06660 [Kocuria palustris]|nr:hypothetical protein [Kocuria palustris]
MQINPKFKLFKLKNDKPLTSTQRQLSTTTLFSKSHSLPLTPGTTPLHSPLSKQESTFGELPTKPLRDVYSTYSTVLLPEQGSRQRYSHNHTSSHDTDMSVTTLQEETEHLIPPLPRLEPGRLVLMSAASTPQVGMDEDDSERLANNILVFVSHRQNEALEWAV